MEYLLSKLLPLLAYPLGLAIVLGVLGLLFGWASRRAAAALFAMSALTLLWMSATPVFSDFVLRSLEKDYPPVAVEQLPSADAIVVLGGISPGVVPGTATPELRDGVDRLFHAMRLYRAGKAPVILLPGGAAEGFPAESKLMAELLQEFGIQSEVLLLETKSRNTRQNAIYSLEIMGAHGIKRILLATSAFHMKRARAVFQRLGVEVIPAATDYQVVAHEETVLDWLPDAESLARTTVGIKEYLGWWVYRWRGWVR